MLVEFLISHLLDAFDKRFQLSLSIWPQPGRDADLFYFGRGALWQAIHSLSLSASDNILVPSYHCGVEIEAVSMTGVQLRYYDIREDFTIDISDVQGRIDADTKAILRIHYFGFPQPIEALKDLCTTSALTLIEDCSQALFSSCKGIPLGKFGDMAIFSQRKTLPLPDGGALVINNPRMATRLPAKKPGEYVSVKKALGMLLRATFNLDPRNELPYPFEYMATVINRLITRNAVARYSTGMEIDIDRCSLAMSGTSRQIMDRTTIDHVILRRQDNYKCLLRGLRDAPPYMKIVRDQLPEGVCPLYFPVKIEGVSRSDLQERLLRAGIGVFVFGDQLHPTLPPQQFRTAEILSRSILGLPVHQDLQPADMAYIGETVTRVAGELINANSH